MSSADNMSKLQKAILADAQEDANKILTQAQDQAAYLKKQAETRANANARRLIANAKEEADILQERAAARAQLDAQMLNLHHREDLLQQVLGVAQERLSDMAQRADWPDMARALLVEALREMDCESDPEGFIVHADAITQRIFSDAVLADITKDCKTPLSLGEPLSGKTGILITTHDGHRQYDNSLETRYARMKDELRVDVYRILTGQQS